MCNALIRDARHILVSSDGVVVQVIRKTSFHRGPGWPVAVRGLKTTGVLVDARPDAKSRVAAGLSCTKHFLSEVSLCQSFVSGHAIPEFWQRAVWSG
eukprot:4535519-Pyramimonas_sp.AAC.1